MQSIKDKMYIFIKLRVYNYNTCVTINVSNFRAYKPARLRTIANIKKITYDVRLYPTVGNMIWINPN
ncbi:hypothetical protein V1478_007828 [Vespula squamosa]|uniref:Uncharacterized protein n=1 Tax=Vespula squamosa TaxID=30214 RepID=A0ABD2AYW2_VESSQ